MALRQGFLEFHYPWDKPTEAPARTKQLLKIKEGKVVENITLIAAEEPNQKP